MTDVSRETRGLITGWPRWDKRWTDDSWCTCDDVECPMCSELASFHIAGCPGAAHGMCLQYLDVHSSARRP